MFTDAKVKQIVDRLLSRVRGVGGIQALATVDGWHTGNTRFARNQITTAGEVDRALVVLDVQIGKRRASTQTNQVDDHALDELVARAIAMAKLAPEDPELMPVLGPQHYVPTKSAVDTVTANLTPEARSKAVATALGAGGTLLLAGYLEHSYTVSARGSTAGLVAAHDATACSMTCTARTPDGTGSGWAGASSNRFADLDVGAFARAAVDKATRSAKPRRLDPGRYTVVLEPAAFSPLLDVLIGSLDARRADEGRSAFTKPGGGTRIGEALFGDSITLRSDPGDAPTGGEPFDREGTPLAPTKWIDKGRLTGLTYTRFWAQKQSKQPTGAPSGWTLDPGAATREGLIKGVQRGVLITRVWYVRELDPQTLLVTGLTRDGTFLIDHGELAYPVNNFRLNESPLQILKTCDGLGAGWVTAGDEGGGSRVPPLRCHEFNLASVSDAV